ncbi:MAG: hypothetical protein AAGA72_18205 [Pseudomonadota bacterium]
MEKIVKVETPVADPAQAVEIERLRAEAEAKDVSLELARQAGAYVKELEAENEALKAQAGQPIHEETRAFVLEQKRDDQSFEEAYADALAKHQELTHYVMMGIASKEQRDKHTHLTGKLFPFVGVSAE